MNCCDDFGRCAHGPNCPARAARRVRAGGPPPAEMPASDPPAPARRSKRHEGLRTLVGYSAGLLALVTLVLMVSLLAGMVNALNV